MAASAARLHHTNTFVACINMRCVQMESPLEMSRLTSILRSGNLAIRRRREGEYGVGCPPLRPTKGSGGVVSSPTQNEFGLVHSDSIQEAAGSKDS